jgi:integrase
MVPVPLQLLPSLTRLRDERRQAGAAQTDLVFTSTRKPGTKLTSWVNVAKRVHALANVQWHGDAQVFRHTCITHSCLLDGNESVDRAAAQALRARRSVGHA